MAAPPHTHYARNGDVNIAYQVLGDGPIDLLFIPGWFSHLDLYWELAASRRFFTGLAEFARLIIYDKRGTGLSDPVNSIGSYADRLDDLNAVMEAAGAERPVICALSEGGMIGALFAAANPDRVRSLIMLNAPRTTEDVPGFASWRANFETGWGEGAMFETFLPELPDTPEMRERWGRTQRLSASRGMALQYYDQMVQMHESNPALGVIACPTLVLQGVSDRVLAPEAGTRLAAAIPGSELKQLPCGHLPWVTGAEEVVRAIEEFATGAAPAHRTDRRLATVLFTDIVDSTARATALGDRAWRALLEQHDDVVRDQIARLGGREVKATGDGFLAVFDGPVEAIDCARGAREGTAALGVDTRAGVHMGQCEFRGDDLAGVAVHIGARVASLAGPGEILVSRTVRDLVAGSDIGLEDRGEHVLKGIPDTWRVFAVS